jgi:hypothetical protein
MNGEKILEITGFLDFAHRPIFKKKKKKKHHVSENGSVSVLR